MICLQEERVRLGMISGVDAAVGSIMNTLDTLGARQDTVVIFMADNSAGRKYISIVIMLNISLILHGKKRILKVTVCP